MTASLTSLASQGAVTAFAGTSHGVVNQAGLDQGWDCSAPRVEWVTQAKCRNGNPDALFVRGAEQRKAAAICQGCPVLLRCLADALDNRVEFGVWGGLTERQRRALLRKNPQVHSWAEYLANGGELLGI